MTRHDFLTGNTDAAFKELTQQVQVTKPALLGLPKDRDRPVPGPLLSQKKHPCSVLSASTDITGKVWPSLHPLGLRGPG